MQIVQREVRMKKLLYRPKDAWVGDLIPYYENGTFYGYYLHDPRIRDKEYAEETTWHLVTTKDFVNVEYKGEAIKRGGDDKPNKNAYTGSVIKDKENLYHAFFTAYNEDIKINGKSVQSVMQAVGTDLEHLNTVEEFLFVSDGKQYEEFDWRDPFVYWNEEDECYDMLLASRIKGGGELRGGCIALCKSKDLKQWTYEKPFYAPGMYITMECPEIFKMGNYWYLVFSTFSDQFTTHYRISKSPNGPWEIPEDDVFDTRSDYAIKTASDGQRRFAFGWIASKYGNKDFGPWEWGGTMVFHELIQNPEDGTLKVRVIPGVKEFYDEVQDLKPAAGYNSRITKTEKGIHVISDTLGSGVYEIPEDCFSIEMDVCVKRGHEFGIALSVMMFVSFYEFVPNELIEAAVVDGCSPLRTFIQIVFPLARNTVITIASMYSILIWNDFIFANTFISDTSAKTVAMGLKDYVGAFGNVDWGSTFAAIAISILPPLVIYFALNKWVTAGMTMGATKG